MSLFNERLHSARESAQRAVSSAQFKMKNHYDRKSVNHLFQQGDRVFVLFPAIGSALQANFSGPYEIESKLSKTDYVICTPNRRRKTCIYHINIKALYLKREG